MKLSTPRFYVPRPPLHQIHPVHPVHPVQLPFSALLSRGIAGCALTTAIAHAALTHPLNAVPWLIAAVGFFLLAQTEHRLARERARTITLSRFSLGSKN